MQPAISTILPVCMPLNPIRIQPIFMSIIFHHYQTLQELRQKVIELDNRTGG